MKNLLKIAKPYLQDLRVELRAILIGVLIAVLIEILYFFYLSFGLYMTLFQVSLLPITYFLIVIGLRYYSWKRACRPEFVAQVQEEVEKLKHQLDQLNKFALDYQADEQIYKKIQEDLNPNGVETLVTILDSFENQNYEKLPHEFKLGNIRKKIIDLVADIVERHDKVAEFINNLDHQRAMTQYLSWANFSVIKDLIKFKPYIEDKEDAQKLTTLAQNTFHIQNRIVLSYANDLRINVPAIYQACNGISEELSEILDKSDYQEIKNLYIENFSTTKSELTDIYKAFHLGNDDMVQWVEKSKEYFAMATECTKVSGKENWILMEALIHIADDLAQEAIQYELNATATTINGITETGNSFI